MDEIIPDVVTLDKIKFVFVAFCYLHVFIVSIICCILIP